MSWEANGWALAEDAELWAGWSFDASTVGVGLRDIEKRKEIKVEARKKSERQDGVAPHGF